MRIKRFRISKVVEAKIYHYINKIFKVFGFRFYSTNCGVCNCVNMLVIEKVTNE